MLTNALRRLGPRVGSATFGLQQAAPELYLGGGLLMLAGSVVLVARAHKKSETVLAEPLMDLEEIDNDIQVIEEETGEEFDSREEVRLKYPASKRLVKGCIRLYGPGILMGVGGAALILASHGVMRGRTKALLSTAVMLERGFNTYRARVIEEFGVEADERLYYGAEERTVVSLETTEDGKKKKRKSKKNHIPETPDTMLYTQIFDSANLNWTRDDEEYNEFWLQAAENTMNSQYQWKGYLLLNDVYEQLGFDKTSAGCVVGWHKDAPGDDYVSFGLQKDINQREGEVRWVIDPNVNGPIWRLVDQS